MSFVNHMSKEINCKLVYYGPGLCGKTTNLQFIHDSTNPDSRGKMINLATETERTLFFDFMPLSLGKIGGYNVRFHLYTVPGQVFYDASRKLVLKGADGVIFVADSQPSRKEANIESIENMETDLSDLGTSVDNVPILIQYNKRDLQDIMAVDELRGDLNSRGAPDLEASAKTGEGVFDTLKAMSKMVLRQLKSQS